MCERLAQASANESNAVPTRLYSSDWGYAKVLVVSDCTALRHKVAPRVGQSQQKRRDGVVRDDQDLVWTCH